jgi:hypothetical protein
MFLKRYRFSKDKKKTQGNPYYFQTNRKIPSRVKKNTKRWNKKKNIKKRNEKNQTNSSEPPNPWLIFQAHNPLSSRLEFS